MKFIMNFPVCTFFFSLESLGWLYVKDEVSITEVGGQVRQKLLDSRRPSGKHDSKKKTLDQSISNHSINYIIKPSAGMQIDSSPYGDSNRAKSVSVHPKIMVVDDEPDLALIYESFLTSTGYHAKAFSEPYDALRDFASKPSYYDLVILDIRMHDINGLQLYQSLKAMNPMCKIIFVSSLDAAKELVSILPGISSEHIIRKPVERQHFINAVRKFLGTSLSS